MKHFVLNKKTAKNKCNKKLKLKPKTNNNNK